MASTLWKHQEVGVEKAKELDFFAFFFEQGCGKSRTLIEVLLQKYEKEGRILRTLIVCPDIVVTNWVDEFKKHAEVTSCFVIPLVGTGKERLDALNSAPHNSIFVCNYQTFLMKELVLAFKKLGLEAFVLDESHKIKSYNSKTTKNVLAVSKGAKYRYCLSGTPVTNSEFDIYPQSQFLDGGAALGENFFIFRNKYFVDKNRNMKRSNYFPKWEIKEGAKEEIKARMAPYCMRVEKADCLDLPPVITQVVDVELSEWQGRMYKSLEKDMVATFGDSVVMSDMALTNIIRMQQVVSGFCVDTLGRHSRMDGNRETVLKELLQSIPAPHKVIIWAVFKQNYYDIRRVLKELDLDFVELTGETPANYRDKYVERFRTEPHCRVMMANPKAAGIGINLVEAAYSIRYSRGYSLEDQLQSDARNHRAGSEMHQQIVRIEMLTRGTIDEVIYNALAGKKQIGPAIINHYKKENL